MDLAYQHRLTSADVRRSVEPSSMKIGSVRLVPFTSDLTYSHEYSPWCAAAILNPPNQHLKHQRQDRPHKHLECLHDPQPSSSPSPTLTTMAIISLPTMPTELGHLKKLPPELRNEVYRHALVAHGDITIRNNARGTVMKKIAGVDAMVGSHSIPGRSTQSAVSQSWKSSLSNSSRLRKPSEERHRPSFTATTISSSSPDAAFAASCAGSSPTYAF